MFSAIKQMLRKLFPNVSMLMSGTILFEEKFKASGAGAWMVIKLKQSDDTRFFVIESVGGGHIQGPTHPAMTHYLPMSIEQFDELVDGFIRARELLKTQKG